MTITYSFNDNILAISIKIDKLITSFVTLAKAMKRVMLFAQKMGGIVFDLIMITIKT
jgi:hypothetical protein